MSAGYTSYKCKWTELQQELLSVAGSPVSMLSSFLVGRALEQDYVPGTFDYNMMINFSNSF